ncbi:chemotaxis protein CheW [uncultured Desulfovibrio sp.]|mgnify:FL=1|uniref:chemotaxis protein CheW n=1 Tax=uncultured Desulfovibrio sp. TaxID=167968 RepID=UPI0021FF7ACF|nr:chemotaxis protein CheW [uncultured Desulfovibrio sp.]CAI3226744.1 Positive regulator of CheA protein activity (CheW) [Desulfovibrio diazotrophicus]
MVTTTPEEYFAAQTLDMPPEDAEAPLNAAERAFVQKYLGGELLEAMPVQAPQTALPGLGGRSTATARAKQPTGTAAPGTPEALTKASLRTRLAAAEQLQMVSFYVREQIFLLPVPIIVEVLRHLPLTRLPLAPAFVAGVVNLRGRVTPLLHLDTLLTLNAQGSYTPQSCIIVCGADDMQLGLIVDKVHSMYSLRQAQITWNAEALLGAGAEFLCGMAEIDERLHGIVDPESIVKKVLEG